jgi:hypothetical protein
VALLVAVFTGTIDSERRGARDEAAAIAQRAGLPPAERKRILDRAFADPGESAGPFRPRTPVERRIGAIARNTARDGFAAGFRVAGLAVLLAVPFAWLMRVRPQEHAAPRTEAAVAAGSP